IEDGADLIDIGGESTRPGAESVTVEEEIRRTIPVVAALAKQGIAVSIDTMKPEVARTALDAGAFLVNDVSGFRNPAMRELVQDRKPTVCIMHMQGEPRTMQANPTYRDVVQEVCDYLVVVARVLDLPQNQMWIDPGIGFGKSIEHNLSLLRNLEAFVETGYPVLVGVSRKSFIGRLLSKTDQPLPVADRLEGTLAAQVVAQMKGAKIIRAHDVLASRRAIDMASNL
ncbi:MAG: dihydropteroate synthase, partial [Chlorobia bacterium]|nr:dihydropteroate synthase [Fimbriimonadaceae bacterium]